MLSAWFEDGRAYRGRLEYLCHRQIDPSHDGGLAFRAS
jgi:hypothetical protein